MAARVHAEAADLPSLRTLAEEADVFFESSTEPNPVETGRFYNGLVDLADRPGVEPLRDELRDRALLGLASQLRCRARPGERLGTLLTNLMGSQTHWPAAVVSDAALAVAAATRLPHSADGADAGPDTPRSVRLGAGLVTAVAEAPGSGDVFIGFARGEVVCYRPACAEVVAVADYDLPVAALAADADGSRVAVLRSHAGGRGAISSYARQPDGSFRLLVGMPLGDLSGAWLTPILTTHFESLVGLWDGQELHILETGALGSWARLPIPSRLSPPPTALLVDLFLPVGPGFRVLTHVDGRWCFLEPEGQSLLATDLTWRPSGAPETSLASVPLSWSATGDGDLDVAGVDALGTVHWARLHDRDLVAVNATPGSAVYRAATIVRNDLVAAVHRTGVEWLRCGPSRFTLWRSTAVTIPRAVACSASRRTGELLVVSQDGFVTPVVIPP
jgi:hypothetical protein